MKKQLRVIVMVAFAMTASHYVLAQTNMAQNIVPIISLLLEDTTSDLITGEWQGVEIVATTNQANQDQQDHKAVMDGAGNAWITWKQADGTNPNKYSIWVNRFTPEAGWGIAENIETLDHDAETPTIAMNSTGNVVVVWGYKIPLQTGGDIWQLWGSHLSSDNTTWNTPIHIFGGTEPSQGSPRVPQVSMDDSGNALLVWQMRTSVELMSSYFSANTDEWNTATEFADSSITTSPIKLAMNTNGSAIAVWRENITILVDGFGVTRPIIQGRPFDPINGWGLSQLISFADHTTDVDGSFTPQLSINSSGDATVVWVHDKILPDFNSEANVWSRQYSATSGWQSSVLLETNDLKFAITPQIAMNDSGKAIAIWVHKSEDLASGLKSIWVNSYDPISGWANAQEIKPTSVFQNVLPLPQIGMDQNGNAVAVWLRKSNSTNETEAIRFDQQAGEWGTIEIIGAEAENTDDPLLVADDLGRALTVWKTGSFFDPDTLKSNYYR